MSDDVKPTVLPAWTYGCPWPKTHDDLRRMSTERRYVREVEAVQYVPGKTCNVLAEWCGAEPCPPGCEPDDVYLINNQEVRMGDWVVREPASGRLSVWSDRRFREMHRSDVILEHGDDA